MEERLQKVIAKSGVTSRRKAESLIINGNVTVNDKVVRELGTKVKSSDKILVNGNPIEKEEKVYFLVNKPRGYICSVSDPYDRKVVTNLIDTDKRIFPVGRLDYDTTGALILTNDGELSNILTASKNRVPKTYLAKLNKVISMSDFYELKKGTMIAGRCVKITRIKIKKTDKKLNTCMIELTIEEGRNHIVKRMFQKFGYDVTALTRISFANLDVKNLKSGEYRIINKKEVHELYSYKRS